MNKKILFLILFFLFVDSLMAIEYKKKIEVALKKDEKKVYIVKYDNKTKYFDFRWTLYKNGGLVIHRRYDHFVAQHMLYKRDKAQSFRVELLSRAEPYYDRPYLLVQFRDFKSDEKKAIFDIYLVDNQERIYFEELKESKED